MRILNLIFFVFLSIIAFSQYESDIDSKVKNENLVGEWILDLRPTPEAEPYLQSFIVSDQGDGKFEGQFYGSPIQEFFFNKSWDRLYFAFKSSDNSNEYYQSGYIIGDEIFGTTFCPGRDFIMPWSGKKKKG